MNFNEGTGSGICRSWFTTEYATNLTLYSQIKNKIFVDFGFGSRVSGSRGVAYSIANHERQSPGPIPSLMNLFNYDAYFEGCKVKILINSV